MRHARWQLTKLQRRTCPAAPALELLPAKDESDRESLRAGDWVRVLSYDEICKRLNDGKAPDGLEFIEAPMRKYCGRTLRVVKVIEHFYDEAKDKVWKKRRPGTVLLEGAACDSSQLGIGHCDRGCLLFWNETWLERTDAPTGEEAGPGGEREHNRNNTDSSDAVRHVGDRALRGSGQSFKVGHLVRIRTAEQINRTLDQDGTCEGIQYVPEHMDGFCGTLRVVSGTVTRYFDERDNHFVEFECGYKLAGVTCSGVQGDGKPTCDRLCSLIWHQRWLEEGGLNVPGPDGTPRVS